MELTAWGKMQKLSILKNSRLVTRLLLALFLVLLICVVFVGLNNPTGIILGWLAITALLTSMVRHWRKIRYFVILLFATVLGAIFLSAVYVEVAYPLAQWFGGADVVETLSWRIFHVVISNVILLFTPVGVFLGIVGTVWLAVLRLVALRRNRTPEGT